MEMGKGHKKTSFFDVNAKKIYYVKNWSNLNGKVLDAYSTSSKEYNKANMSVCSVGFIFHSTLNITVKIILFRTHHNLKLFCYANYCMH